MLWDADRNYLEREDESVFREKTDAVASNIA